jgi:hypothetical protein
MQSYRGSCECGKFAIEVSGDISPVFACHCVQCRKSSGHYWAAVPVPTRQISVISDETLAWYQSTDVADKAFCRNCGSSIFWRLAGRPTLHVSAGLFDDDLPAKLDSHRFISERGTYYDITNSLPQAGLFDIDVPK